MDEDKGRSVAMDEDKRRKKSKDYNSESGVVYVGHLPHGFYEEQLKSYFSQFGNVNQVRVARNKKVTRTISMHTYPTF